MPAKPAACSLAWKARAELRSQRRAAPEPARSSSERLGALTSSQARARARKSGSSSGAMNSLLRRDLAVHVGIGRGPGNQAWDDLPQLGRVPPALTFDAWAGVPPFGHRDLAAADAEDAAGDATRRRAAQPDDQRRDVVGIPPPALMLRWLSPSAER